MMRTTLAVLLFFCTLVYGVSAPVADSAITLLVDRPPQSLRSETIDLDDYWNSARLLAHFGENNRAYEILRQRPASGAMDLQVERFESRLLTEIGLYRRADSLLALQTFVDDERTYFLHYLRRARINAMAGEYDRALEFLELIEGVDVEAFQPYRDLLEVECLLQIENPLAACDVAEKRLAHGVPLSLTPEFEALLLEAYLGADRNDDALELIEILKAKTSKRSTLAPLVAREVDIRFMLGDTLAAVEAAYELTQSSPTRGAGIEAFERLIALVPLDDLSDEILLGFSESMVRRNRLAAADPLVDVLAKRELDENGREQRRMIVGEMYYRQKRYSKSYGKLEKPFDDAPLESRAKLYRARIYRKTGQPVRAADAYEIFARAYPYEAKSAEALYVASDLNLGAGKLQKSAELLNRIIETYPSNRYSRLATLKIAQYYIDRGELTKGAGILEQLLEKKGRRDATLLYNLAIVYGMMGEPERKAKALSEIETLNPVSFYLEPEIPEFFEQPMMASNGSAALHGQGGLLEFLKMVYEKRTRAYEAVRDVVEPLEDTSSIDASRVYLERGRVFLQMGFRDWAERELRIVESKKKLPARVYLELGVLYDDFAMPWRSVRSFQRVYYTFDDEKRRELYGYFKLLTHPVPFPGVVFENCSRYGMAPHLVYAMMRQESRFDDKAVSRAGALGLMQLMPATGEQVADELGFPDVTQANLLSPSINLTFGIWYASHLLERSNDNPQMMLASYNAGFGNGKRWFGGRHSKDPTIDKVESIDYRETRTYVKNIVESARIYHAYYFDTDRDILGLVR